MRRRTFVTALGTSTVPLTLAGCTATSRQSNEDATDTPDTGTETPTVSCPPEKEPEPAIRASNRDTEPHALAVTVTKDPDEENQQTVYERSFELSPDTRESVDDRVFPEPGEYRMTVSLEAGASESYNRTIDDEESLEWSRKWGGFQVTITETGTLQLNPFHADPSSEYRRQAEKCD